MQETLAGFLQSRRDLRCLEVGKGGINMGARLSWGMVWGVRVLEFSAGKLSNEYWNAHTHQEG